MPTPISRVVVLMLENHSFDRVLGWTKQNHPTLEGVDPDNPGINPDYPVTTDTIFQAETRSRRTSTRILVTTWTMSWRRSPTAIRGSLLISFRRIRRPRRPSGKRSWAVPLRLPARDAFPGVDFSWSATTGSPPCRARPGPTGSSRTAAPRSVMSICPGGRVPSHLHLEISGRCTTNSTMPAWTGEFTTAIFRSRCFSPTSSTSFRIIAGSIAGAMTCRPAICPPTSSSNPAISARTRTTNTLRRTSDAATRW